METSDDASDQSFVIQEVSIRESTWRQMGDALAAWTEASMAKAEWYRARSHAASDYSIAKCVAALEEMRDDISNDIYFKALDKFKDPDWREMFIVMPNDRKREWLNRL